MTRLEGQDGGPITHQLLVAPIIKVDVRLLETDEAQELVDLTRKNPIDLSDMELLRLRDLRRKAQPITIDVAPSPMKTIEYLPPEASE